MSDQSFSELLRELSKSYYQHHIGFTEYRAKRKEVLDLIDAEFNGYHHSEVRQDDAQESSMLSRAFGLFKTSNTE